MFYGRCRPVSQTKNNERYTFRSKKKQISVFIRNKTANVLHKCSTVYDSSAMILVSFGYEKYSICFRLGKVIVPPL